MFVDLVEVGVLVGGIVYFVVGVWWNEGVVVWLYGVDLVL